MSKRVFNKALFTLLFLNASEASLFFQNYGLCLDGAHSRV
ncbi:hypothetical protein CCACVL1_05983 [Corchorus capsularis]|uniref:Uncharacterized protein n=1 Tax=Corchorus capsularis TaxID=210143 RepID=A0A1R3JI80_COCAP|nr:hypothetical protein CCACVL1_05983 [Corchorus capsularis]